MECQKLSIHLLPGMSKRQLLLKIFVVVLPEKKAVWDLRRR